MKRLIVISLILVTLLISAICTAPLLAQTRIATLIPWQPLSSIAAEQVITHSGLTAEELADGTTNELTKCRDAVNAYRYAHDQISSKGWYRGLSDDHTVLLQALVNEIERQGGYKTNNTSLASQSSDILKQFYNDSDTQNAVELGFESVESLNAEITDTGKSGELEKEAFRVYLSLALETKWK
jgi:hypothetical protein